MHRLTNRIAWVSHVLTEPEAKGEEMSFARITVDPDQMGGVPRIRGLRIPVATVIGMMADQLSEEGILAAYRFRQDLFQTLQFLECFHAFSQSVIYLNDELCGGGYRVCHQRRFGPANQNANSL